MGKPIRMVFAAAALAPVALLAACGSSGSSSSSSSSSASSSASAAAMQGPALPTAPATASASLTETGSTLLFPLISAWATDYQTLYKQLTITTGGTGSGTGLADAATGTVDIGASDAYLSSSARSQTPTLLNIALAISAQQVNYNVPGVTGHIKLDAAVLAQMYSGKITTWNDPAIKALNPGLSLPSLKVVPLHRADSSGDTFIFTSYLNAQDPSGWTSSNVGTTVTWPSVPGELGEQGNGGMVQGCGATKGCVAYIGVSYLAKTQAAGLGQAELKNGAGNFVLPVAATISAGAAGFIAKTPASETISMINGPASNGYPIINYEYAIVNTKQSDATTAENIRAFLHWAVHTGNSPTTYLNAVDFQPLPSSIQKLSDDQIAKIGG
ncbi:MAG TPA: phosphate ABC transporter substrate-binding protein PstS [Streptosporangiaceae bacterium]|nr:phosphate ABC transporter substrate-binding protein PstS [Streptosporangiaceae bacterium]